jgi:hypothetical protein
MAQDKDLIPMRRYSTSLLIKRCRRPTHKGSKIVGKRKIFVWNFCFSIVYSLERSPKMILLFQAYSFYQCMFGKQIRIRVNSVKSKWLILKGIVLWCIWIGRNDAIFDDEFIDVAKIHQCIWDQLLYFEHLAWNEINWALNNEQVESILKSFDTYWTRRGVVCSRLTMVVRWNSTPKFLTGFV